MKIEQGTYEESAKQIAGFARDAFKEHVIRKLGDGEWLCKKPESSLYWFSVIARPGMLVFWGDLGEFVLRVHDDDVVRWARSAVNSPSYFQEKILAGDKESFYVGDAQAIVNGAIAGEEGLGLTKKQAEKVEDAISSWDELDEREWYIACNDAGDDEPPRCNGLSPAALWFLETMRWFCAHVDAEPKS